MPLNFYCAYDSKAGVFMRPFLMPTDGEAMRSFRTLVNDADTLCGKYPGDFHLYSIGSYDDASGTIVPHKHTSLGDGLAFVNQEHKDAHPLSHEAPIRTGPIGGNTPI